MRGGSAPASGRRRQRASELPQGPPVRETVIAARQQLRRRLRAAEVRREATLGPREREEVEGRAVRQRVPVPGRGRVAAEGEPLRGGRAAAGVVREGREGADWESG